jgi:uncharacterized protein (DUF433 family)
MTKSETDSDVDWTACALIEQIPGNVSGRPLVRGTRIMPDPIVNSSTILAIASKKFRRAFPHSPSLRSGV